MSYELERALRLMGFELSNRSASYSELAAKEAMIGLGDSFIAVADTLQAEREEREAKLEHNPSGFHITRPVPKR